MPLPDPRSRSAASTRRAPRAADRCTGRRGRRAVEEPAASEPEADAVSRDSMLPLYTPAEAAQILAVRESWLRRRAAARTVPCTFLGKHLRFSRADVLAIATAAAQPSAAVDRPRTRHRRR